MFKLEGKEMSLPFKLADVMDDFEVCFGLEREFYSNVKNCFNCYNVDDYALIPSTEIPEEYLGKIQPRDQIWEAIFLRSKSTDAIYDVSISNDTDVPVLYTDCCVTGISDYNGLNERGVSGFSIPGDISVYSNFEDVRRVCSIYWWNPSTLPDTPLEEYIRTGDGDAFYRFCLDLAKNVVSSVTVFSVKWAENQTHEVSRVFTDSFYERFEKAKSCNAF